VRIAIIDSGIGGLTVLKEALRALPGQEFLYFADTRNVPYGIRPKEEVRALILNAAACMADQGIQALVVACNTATSAAIADLRRTYAFPVIGMEPAVKPALARNAGKRVLVCATSLTLRENKLESLLASLGCPERVTRLALDSLVTFAEAFDFDSPDVRAYLARKFAKTDWSQYESLVLGCTHFLYYRSLIREAAGPDVALLDGNAGTVNRLASLLGLTPGETAGAPPAPPRIAFFTSGGERETPERERRLRALLDTLP